VESAVSLHVAHSAKRSELASAAASSEESCKESSIGSLVKEVSKLVVSAASVSWGLKEGSYPLRSTFLKSRERKNACF